jgi:hypothetical protein
MKTFLIALFSFLCIHASPAQRATPVDWQADLNYLERQLPKNHYDLFALQSQTYFQQGIEKIKASADTLSDLAVAVQLQQLVASMGDSHTKVDFGPFLDKDQVLPLHLYWFSDGLYILHTTPGHEDILGHRILSINQVPIATVVDSLSTLITVDNPAIIKSSVPKMVPLIQLLEYFGFVKNQQVELQLADPFGTPKNHTLEPARLDRKNRKTFQPDSLALCFRNERAMFVADYLPDDRIYYIQYNRCWSKELERKYGKRKKAKQLPSFNDFEQKVFRNLESKPIDEIVFDMRFNGGGNSRQGTQFIEKLAAFLDENPNQKLFVVLGRHTFSSAILNAMDFRRLTDATFVGEATGGKPNHFGEVKRFQLPESKLRVSYSTKYFKRTEDDPDSLHPDVTIETSFEDFRRGIDPVYEWIREQ